MVAMFWGGRNTVACRLAHQCANVDMRCGDRDNLSPINTRPSKIKLQYAEITAKALELTLLLSKLIKMGIENSSPSQIS